jgi:hypothetical protein
MKRKKKKEKPELIASSGSGGMTTSFRMPASGRITVAEAPHKPSNYEYKQDKFLFDAF